MKIINIKFFVFCFVVFVIISCSKEVIVIDIFFSVSFVIVKVGDFIIFLVGYGVESYVLYIGDVGYDFVNSIL